MGAIPLDGASFSQLLQPSRAPANPPESWAPGRPGEFPRGYGLALPPRENSSPQTESPMEEEQSMSRWTEEIRRLLERSPGGALPLSAIRRELEREGIRLDPRDPQLHTSLREEGELFHVVPLYLGPWKGEKRGEEGVEGRDDCWVTLLRCVGPGMGADTLARRRIQESVGAWASALDRSSPRRVARWVKASLEGVRVCTALVKAGG
jgi:hypothetical protein